MKWAVYAVFAIVLAGQSLARDLSRSASYSLSARSLTQVIRIDPIHDIDSLLAQVSQDSIVSYVHRLVAFGPRLAGTDSNYAARDWLANKFAEFGYDSVSLFPFTGYQLPGDDAVPCYNVIAFKPGSVYPERQIIVGTHFDTDVGCPGADDNASGIAAMLEMARLLQPIDLPMSLVFVGFDSYESGTNGSYAYLSGVLTRGDDIVAMIDPSMIGYVTNSNKAKLYCTQTSGYADLWMDMASQHAGITGYCSNPYSTDFYPFVSDGFEAFGIQEYETTPYLSTPNDSEVYLNFDYMTRMTQATLATAYSITVAPPPVQMSRIDEPGTGSSELVRWHDLTSPNIAEYRVYYQKTEPTMGPMDSLSQGPADSSGLVTGLSDGATYEFHVMAFDDQGRTSYDYDPLYGYPSSLPVLPTGLTAWPLHNAVRLYWKHNNAELDFARYGVVRDGSLIGTCTDTNYIDYGPSLGGSYHDYRVMAIDTSGNYSDTSGTSPVQMRAATLDPNRILAVNSSTITPNSLVDEVKTGIFLRNALIGYDFDYFSDTAAASTYNDPSKLLLKDMLDYGLVVVASEGGFTDAIGGRPDHGGILDTLAYYMSIGGKVIIFGRWGGIYGPDTLNYTNNSLAYDDAYRTVFGIDYRVQTATTVVSPDTLKSDFVGAHSVLSGYPDITWDSSASVLNCIPYFYNLSGIPYESWVKLTGSNMEPIYAYVSGTGNTSNDGQVVGWRHLGQDYAFTWFDFPLSFMTQPTSFTLFHKAVDDLQGMPTDVTPGHEHNLPDAFALYQNYPNPFNPTTTIEYDLPAATHVNLTIFNLLGQQVRTVLDDRQIAGHHQVVWDGRTDGGRPVASGIYLYRLIAGNHSASRKMVLLK